MKLKIVVTTQATLKKTHGNSTYSNIRNITIPHNIDVTKNEMHHHAGIAIKVKAYLLHSSGLSIEVIGVYFY